MKATCMVCSGASAQYHFGATVCRACAAFFRRYVNSRKLTILCNCLSKKESQYPCRLCRMKKCISIGMVPSKVQGPRDVNNQLNRKMIEGSSSPESVYSQINLPIKLRSTQRIDMITKGYNNLESTRKTIFNNNKEANVLEVNLYELSLEIKTDTKLLWKLCETAFPEFDHLNRNDKKILFYNFYSKWSIMELSMFSAKHGDPYNFYSPSGAVATSIDEFYLKSVRETSILSEEEVVRIFQPFWTYHFDYVIKPLSQLKFGDMENMAILGIMLWDAGYANINENLAEVCRAMRTIICRELSSHFEETDKSSERLFEALNSLSVIERAEHKCQEEIELCGVYNMEIDEDMRNIIMWEKH